MAAGPLPPSHFLLYTKRCRRPAPQIDRRMQRRMISVRQRIVSDEKSDGNDGEIPELSPPQSRYCVANEIKRLTRRGRHAFPVPITFRSPPPPLLLLCTARLSS